MARADADSQCDSVQTATYRSPPCESDALGAPPSGAVPRYFPPGYFASSRFDDLGGEIQPRMNRECARRPAVEDRPSPRSLRSVSRIGSTLRK
jgi:hypothetical protein